MLLFSASGVAQNTFPTNGNVGIGTLTPQYPLDVNGSARITGNLLVGGGIITASVVNSTGPVNAGDVNVTNNLNVTGSINVSGQSTSNFGGIIAANDVKTQGAFLFNTPGNTSQLGLKVFGPYDQVNTGPVINIGDPVGVQNPPVPCGQANAAPWLQVQGNMRMLAQNGNVNASLSMYSAPWSGDGFFEIEGVNSQNLPTNALYVNYFCGRDILLGTGIGPGSPNLGKGGAKVFTGDYVEMRKHAQIGSSAGPITDANNTALDIFSNAGKGLAVNTTDPTHKSINVVNNSSEQFVVYGNGATHIATNAQIGFNNPVIQDANTTLNISNPMINGIKFNTWNNAAKLISISNINFPLSPFTVYGDGRTFIGQQAVIGAHADASLLVSGKIACKSLFVLKPTTWQDNVFSENYELKSLSSVHEFITKEKHLEGIPSEKEILENGYDLNEMDAALLGKIESLYLYVIKQEKMIETQRDQIQELKKELSSLKK